MAVLGVCADHLCSPSTTRDRADDHNDHDFLATAVASFLDSPHKCPDNKISHLEDLFYQEYRFLSQ